MNLRWMIALILAMVSLAPATAHHDGTATPPETDCLQVLQDEAHKIDEAHADADKAWSEWKIKFEEGEDSIESSNSLELMDAYYADMQTSADQNLSSIVTRFYDDIKSHVGDCHGHVTGPTQQYHYQGDGYYWLSGKDYYYGDKLDSTSSGSSTSGDQGPPPGTSEEGSSTNPDGTASGDTDPCADMWKDHGEQIDGLYADNQAAWDGFFADMKAEEEAKHDAGADHAEWDLWMREKDSQAATLHDRLVAEFWSAAEAILGDCAWKLGEPGRQFYYHGDGSKHEEPAGDDGTYMHPEPEYSDDPELRAIEEQAWKIRRDCADRVWDLWMAHDAKDWSSQEEQDAARADVEAEVHRIERDCEAKVRALFDAYYDQHRNDGFEESFGSIRMYWSEEEHRIIVEGKYLEMRGIPEEEAMADVQCRGSTYIDYMAPEGDLGEFRPQQTDSGTALNVYDASGRLSMGIHDNERCVINIRTTPDVPVGILDLADRLDCGPNEAGDIVCHDGDVRIVVLVHEGDVEQDSHNRLFVHGAATFLVRPGTGSPAFGSAYDDAVEAKRIGAEVKIAAGASGLSVDAAPLGDMQVRIEGEPGEVTAYVESEAGIGKTVSLSIDPSLLDAEALGLKAWAVEDGVETPLDAREADSLSDVLDPHDDGETIEYWVVKDNLGWQVLVSFPHFSEKRVTVTPETVDSAGLAVDVPGVSGVLVASLLVAAVALVRRRL